MADATQLVIEEFNQVVNMTEKQLNSWLEINEAKEVGQKKGGGESTGHESGRRIIELLDKKKSDH